MTAHDDEATPRRRRAGSDPTDARAARSAAGPSARRAETNRAAQRADAKKPSTTKPSTTKPSTTATGPGPDVVRPVPAARTAFAAGAARASGERRRRSGTPLLPGAEPVEVTVARRDATAARPEAAGGGAAAPTSSAADATTGGPARKRPPRQAIRERREQRARERALRPVPSLPTPDEDLALPAEPAQRHTEESAKPATETAGVVGGLQATAERIVGAVLEAAEFSSEARPGPAELVELAVNLLRSAAAAAGVPAEEVERHVAETLAYVRRRLTGDYEVDEFGFDEDYTTHIHLPLLRPLYKSWFRVEVKGIENIPATGGALVVANHSGTVAMDSLMTQVAVYDEHPNRRHLRMLGADLVFQTPFVGPMARRSGSTLAANTDAERLLSSGHLVGVWPEGFKGVGKPFSERYKLQRFGRGGFVAAALRAGVPIVPCSIIGAEEIYPMIGNMPTVARLLGLPYVPITPTFPWLGPLGAIPLPSKWLIEFGPPIETTTLGPDAADDPMLVFDLTDQVRETIQQTLYSLLMQRRSVFT
ncbi:1-acyl-sn-glycerol-3-phosphate acyltransferase [Intrasporangium calvum]|uniref:Phospholipid/glycerol acyltransferase n=1 Tax=Intrasporangium calvum (strain ATCC 23552 / DSM 43043 / JCM 3097 / NBRC 12989 / NCIMB 10167 / NRRL B-3866 / 7 KIP) TaxID=710696 RepID=E6SAE6_INTC7|nr:1-acyl-sn-glycerol-3-phosphate acyltransferase [Intrasporangium calvum]ADU47196.1 phospholipid/glycerol acyltransferase [Intrasporangium calvum DSM 43043]